MPTLLLTPRQTEDAQALWRGCTSLGWDVQRVHGWKIPAVDPADVAVYAEPLLATHIAQTLGIELLEPTIDWLPSVPESGRRWRLQLPNGWFEHSPHFFGDAFLQSQ